MGVVYRAIDERLNRAVALKVIGRVAATDESRRRFLKEARAASAFSHPNIVTIHEVDQTGDIDFIVMELLPGQSLDKRITAGPMPIDEVIACAEQVAAGLAAADAAGVVHRDIKPANVMVTDSGHVKLLDFGIAKQLAPASTADANTLTVVDPTVPGAVLGSVAYMSPEQAQGHAVDSRSDVFSFGVLLYEMLAGKRPFSGTTAVETVAKILEATPPPIETIRKEVPSDLAALVAVCLEKDRARRPTAANIVSRIATLRRARTGDGATFRSMLRRPVVAAAVLITLAIVGGIGVWWWESGGEVRQARRRIQELKNLAEREDSYAFYQAAHDIIALLPEEGLLQQRWNDLTFAIPAIHSEPPGAAVQTRGYSSPDDGWISLGHTPIENARFPRGTSRLQISKDGYAPYEGTVTLFALDLKMQPAAAVPAGMTLVPGGAGMNEGKTFDTPAFWMDRFEITNRQFKAFVDAGGYTNAEFWKEPFRDRGTTLSWDEAMKRFRDRTGRPGPSTWELGSFPEGQADFPVSGVSWYEAAAYAVFAGKSLPTAFQWRRAGDFAGPSTVYSDILSFSNFSMKGPVAVGQLKGIGPFGQYDMAGNVKEWCWNASQDGRMILGGAWNEPQYMYEDRDAQPAMARLMTYGFRLVKNIEPQPEASYGHVARLMRDFSLEKPIDESAFRIVAGLYADYATPLNVRSERTEDARDWRHQTITMDGADGEPMPVHIYLPNAAAPPFQTVVYFPGGDASLLRSSRDLNLTAVDFVIRSGRALIFPVYASTYERTKTPGIIAERRISITRVKEVRRVVDYVSTRKDLDGSRLAFYGASMGAFHGVLTGAFEQRIKTFILVGAGYPRVAFPPEIDLPNFAPRMHAPTLLVSGDNDFQHPLETAQVPLFRALGVPADQKRHALFKGGHMPYQINEIIKEILDWLDKYLGPVTPPSANNTR